MKTLKHLKLAAAAMALLFLAGSGAHAQQAQTPTASNHTISYQGTIVEMDGSAVKDSTYPITVSIWTDATQGTRLWRDVFQTEVKGGIFNILLGSQIPLPSPALMDQPLWLGVSFNTDLENLPRFKLGTVVSAMNVADSAITTRKLATGAVASANLADSAVTTQKLADGAVTWNKMGTEYVPYIRVNGTKVTTGHNPINFTGSEGMIVDYDSTTMSVTVHPDTSLLSGTDGKGTKPLWIGANGTSHTGPCGSNVDNLNGTNSIGGGCANVTINSIGYGSILGGLNNTIKSNYSTVVGGDTNFIDTLADISFLGGGLRNTIGDYGGIAEIGDTIFEGGNVIGGGIYNRNVGAVSTIGGGGNNFIDSLSVESFIGGGAYNTVGGNGPGSIVGGDTNTALGGGSIIGGGTANYIGASGSATAIVAGSRDSVSAAESLIGSGFKNTITSTSGQGFIGSGIYNWVNRVGGFIGVGLNDSINAYQSAAVSGEYAKIDSNSYYSIIGAGSYNHIFTNSQISFIGGGSNNTIDTNSQISVIVGGSYNHIDTSSPNSIIGGGMDNLIQAPIGVIVGGSHNGIQGSYSAIVGGDSNYIGLNSYYSFVGGGQHNWVPSTAWAYSTVVGGDSNSATGPYAFLGGGHFNTAQGLTAVMGGGDTNAAGGDYCVVAGGRHNAAIDDDGVISGGDSNFAAGGASVIAGGRNNVIEVPFTAIGGGDSNFSNWGEYSTIAGGHNNTARDTAVAIGGGWVNFIDDGNPYSTIGGGRRNSMIEDNAPYATIPGGDSLTANSFAQTVVGFHNIVTGTIAEGTPTAGIDTALFIVGNGTTATPSNAFQVSYDGHSTVFDNNGSGGSTVAPLLGRHDIYGSSYQDNLIVAWGVLSSGVPDPITNIVHTSSDFGVQSIISAAVGVYTIQLNVIDPATGSQRNFTNAAVTVTPMDPAAGMFCGTVIATPVSGTPGIFTVKVRNGSCMGVDIPFMFQVVGR